MKILIETYKIYSIEKISIEYIIMNYLDLLPDDVMKIINRKVHDLQIKHRKIERIENQRKMIEQNE